MSETSIKLTPRQQRMLAEHQRKLTERQNAQNESDVSEEDTSDSLPVALFQTLESVYQSLYEKSKQGQAARELVLLRDWFTSICRFDPLTCEPEPMGADELLQKIRQYNTAEIKMEDRFGRVLEHSLEALKNILLEIRTQIFREHKVLPIYAVHEVDSKSIQWLSRKAGRSIREKLSGNPYLLAVNKRMSVNTAENRLFKVFVWRLEQLLFTRQETVLRLQNNTVDTISFHLQDKYADDISDILGLIRLWYGSDDYDEIGEWKNPPPNNTLLQNRNYRKILDSWNWLNAIDEDTQRDHLRIKQDVVTMFLWRVIAELSNIDGVRMLQFPCSLNYDGFSIKTGFSGVIGVDTFHNSDILLSQEDNTAYLSCNGVQYEFAPLQDVAVNTLLQNDTVIQDLLERYVGQTKRREQIESQKIQSDSVVIDLCSIRPSILASGQQEESLPFRLLAQHWTTKDGEQLLDCRDSNAILLSDNIETIGMSELFLNNTDYSHAKKSQVAKLFCETLKENITSQTLTYLIPDCINDFEIETLRKSINFYFSEAEPLPRSISAVLAWQASPAFKKHIIRENDVILAMENVGDRFTITKIVCQYNPQLAKDIPTTLGFFWERHPVREFDSPFASVIENILVGKNGNGFAQELLYLLLHEDILAEAGKLSFYQQNSSMWYHIENSKQLANKINPKLTRTTYQKISEEILGIIGGSKRVHLLQYGFLRLPPDLFNDNRISNINFQDSILQGGIVLKNWQAKTEEAIWKDHLPNLSLSNKWGESIDLVKDETIISREKKRNITIKSHFGLPAGQKEITFDLIQGDKKLRPQFEACLQSPKYFPLPQNVECRLELTFSYGADNPYELKFIPIETQASGFQSVTAEWRVKKDISIDLDTLPIPTFPSQITSQKRQKDIITSEWEADRNGYEFCKTENRLSIYRNRFLCNTNNIKVGTHITYIETTTEKNGRRYTNAVAIRRWISPKIALEMLKEGDEKEIQSHRWDIAAVIKKADSENMLLVFQYLLEHIQDEEYTHHFLWILSIAFWREESLILHTEFNAEQIIRVLQVLKQRIKWAVSLKNREDRDEREEKIIKSSIIVGYLELLLAILRSRVSENKEIKEILAPYKGRTKDFIELLKKIRELKIPIQSRISLSVDKPEQFRDVPNLLYAVEMYLRGDSGADSIKIIEVKEE